MKWGTLIAVVLGGACSSCAPIYIDVQPDATKQLWVERSVVEEHAAIGNFEKREIILVDSAKNQQLSPEERVVWIAGIDPLKSKLQRGNDRSVSHPVMDAKDLREGQYGFVEVHQFPVSKGVITASGQLRIEKFKTDSKARYYVEFLNKGPMTEAGVEEMLKAWKSLSKTLKLQGLEAANLVMGGSKYDQEIDAIVLVRVGK